MLIVLKQELNSLMLIEPKVFSDERGYFFETYNKREYAEIGINCEFVQDNQSLSQKGTIRGMHFQYDKPQGKLIRVLSGKATFREIDIRINSPHFGKYREFELSAENKHILWVPAGFANGFAAEEDNTIIHYKCTEFWNPQSEVSILYNDEEVGISWNIENPILSPKDLKGITLSQWKDMNISIE